MYYIYCTSGFCDFNWLGKIVTKLNSYCLIVCLFHTRYKLPNWNFAYRAFINPLTFYPQNVQYNQHLNYCVLLVEALWVFCCMSLLFNDHCRTIVLPKHCSFLTQTNVSTSSWLVKYFSTLLMILVLSYPKESRYILILRFYDALDVLIFVSGDF